MGLIRIQTICFSVGITEFVSEVDFENIQQTTQMLQSYYLSTI